MKNILPIVERFRAFQGEGVHMGRPAFFIRTYGCATRCPWCDSAGTWHPNYVPEVINQMTIEQLKAEAVQEPRVEFVVVTGGEPTHHNLDPLLDGMSVCEMPVHLETSGAYSFPSDRFRWITLSPKRWKMPTFENWTRPDEMKFIIESPEDIEFYTTAMRKGLLDVGFLSAETPPIWLHPEWSHREDPIVLKAICEAVVNGRGLYRAGWQIHKEFLVDRMDGRSSKPAPLGGNLEKGY